MEVMGPWRERGAESHVAQLRPRKVGSGSLKYNIIHEQATTKTTVIRHTHTHTSQEVDETTGSKWGRQGCIIKLRTGVEGLGTHKFLASPGERPVAEVAGFLKHQHLHLKVQAAAFRFWRLKQKRIQIKTNPWLPFKALIHTSPSHSLGQPLCHGNS